MPFTVTTQPLAYSPAYNQLDYVVYDSTYAGKVDFKYIFDLYVDGALVNTTKLYPRTGGYCIYNPAKIIQDYVSAAYIPALVGPSIGYTAELVTYYVVFKTEYIVDDVETTFTMLTGDTKMTWNAAATFMDAMNLSTYVAKFVPSVDGEIDFLNFKETDHINILDNEYRNASMIYKTQDDEYLINQIYVETSSGKQYTDPITLSGATKYYDIMHYGVGIPQLNAVDWDMVTLPPGVDITINADEDKWYIVKFQWNSGGSPGIVDIMKPLKFYIKDHDCQKNNVYTLAYQSPNGGFGHVPVYARNDFSLNVAKQTYKSNISNPIGTSREHVVFNNQAQRGLIANTNWLTTQNQIEEVMDCIASPRVYLVYGTLEIPVNINDSTYKHAQKKYDKTVQYTMELTYAYDEFLIK
jgi:hypothetical protein